MGDPVSCDNHMLRDIVRKMNVKGGCVLHDQSNMDVDAQKERPSYVITPVYSQLEARTTTQSHYNRQLSAFCPCSVALIRHSLSISS